MALRIFADFQNSDPDGNIRLNTYGTKQDVERLNIKFELGLEIVVSDGELETDGIVKFSEKEKIWVAEIEWNKLRDSE